VITRARGRIAKKTFIRAKAYPSVPFDASLAKFKADAAWKPTKWPAAMTR
jgi:hypothetical protein